MEDLKVVVHQQTGTISMNFEELKTALETEMKKYEAMVYDESAIATAKSDAAYLRKLKKSVEDRRKEVKTKCLEPYEMIEKQCNELTELIDKPINLIAGQVKDYEDAAKAKKKAEILEYMSERFKKLPETVAARLKSKIYDNRWENATATKKSWKEAIDAAAEAATKDLKLLDNVDGDFKDDVMKAYLQNLELGDALMKANEMAKQKARIVERERQRQEAKKMAALEQARKAGTVADVITVKEKPKAEREFPKPETPDMPFEMEKTFTVVAEVVESDLASVRDFLNKTGIRFEVR